MKVIASLVLVVASLISLPSQAALIKFDVGSLTGFFSPTQLAGSFVLDTNNQSVSDITLMVDTETFTSGFAIDGATGFGLRETSFLFAGTTELLFELSGIDRFMPGLAVGESVNVSAFVSQADDFNDDYQNVNPFSPNSNVFQGNIVATRLNEVSAPLGMSFLAIGLAGFISLKRKQSTRIKTLS